MSKNNKKKESAVTKEIEKKEEEGFTPTNPILSKELRLEIMISHLERESVKKDMQLLYTKLEFLDREKVICNLQMSDKKALLNRKEKDHQDLIHESGKKVGLDLKGSVINQETGEITFV